MLRVPVDPAELMWPYSGIVADLRAAVVGKANFLVALGLLVYTEVMGRWILQERGNSGPSHPDSFYCFYEKYMGKKGARRRKVYEHFRHGLAHGYTFNAADLSRVRMRPDPDWLPPDSRVPVVTFQKRRIKSFLINAYFRDFQRGLVKWAAERPDLVLQRPKAKRVTKGRKP